MRRRPYRIWISGASLGLLLLCLEAFGTPAMAASPHVLRPGVSAVADGAQRIILWDRMLAVATVVQDGDPLGGGTKITPAAGCYASAVDGDRLLFGCDDAGSGAAGPLLYDIGSGRWRTPDGAAKVLDFQRHVLSSGLLDTFTFTGLGRNLAVLSGTGGKGPSISFVDLETGTLSNPVDNRNPRRYSTPDAPSGTRALCRPVARVARRANPDGLGRRRQLQSAVQVGRWTLRWWPEPATPWYTPRLLSALTLQRCGSRRTVPLTRGGFDSPVLTRRYAAWVRGNVLHVHRLHGGRSSQVRLPPLMNGLHYSLAGTEHRIAASAPGSGRATRIYEVG